MNERGFIRIASNFSGQSFFRAGFFFCKHILKRKRGNESPLYKEGVTDRIAESGDCLKSGNEQEQSSVSLTLAISFPKEADGNRKPSL